MASVTKFTAQSVSVHLRHIDRKIAEPANVDIDPEHTHLNYTLSPDRGVEEYLYYKQRLSELYVYKRDDVKTMAGWITTAPQALHESDYSRFFEETYRFIASRYGEENIVKAVVHMDEAQPHMHTYFVPVTPDANPRHWQTEKVCANDVLTRRDLLNFHPDWERHLAENGINAAVRSGITKAQGGNRHVWELKQERQYTREHKIKHEMELHF